MVTQTPRSFNGIRNDAHRIGKMLTALSKGGACDSRIDANGKKLLEIATALTLIAETPNTSLNREALETWSFEIDLAVAAFEEWLKETLAPNGEEHEPGYYINF